MITSKEMAAPTGPIFEICSPPAVPSERKQSGLVVSLIAVLPDSALKFAV